ncbi:hypothetical protein CYMTET_46476 [Cymbomonas tetramitiformis]|uniref:Uncharacterized protein n=1 Tax=Cymbomonas tetramitiformis TaxID=36881 RepID=A0AAE0EX94_9CHLO|nr:hypothetical protein CYMTET_46476 [Cymbomonas tetramitiformis]
MGPASSATYREQWVDFFLLHTGEALTNPLSAGLARLEAQAAEQGEVRAANNLGVCYEKGIGVEEGVCLRKAVFWYRKAAELGNAPGQCNLGVCFQEGKGVERCDKVAVEWYIAAAKQGYAEAQWRLGRCFRRGEGVSVDVAQAIAWFEKGAAQEHARAIIELEELRKEPAAEMEHEVEATMAELPLSRTPDLSEMRTCSNPNCKFWDAEVGTHHCRPRTAGGKVHAIKVHYCSDECRRGHVTTFACF